MGGKTSRTFTLTVRLPGRGTVPLVLSGKNIVVTPDAAHELQVVAGDQAGKPMLCAKPMTTVAGCQRMPVHHSVNDEIATLVLLYPDHLPAELTVTAVFEGGSRVGFYGDTGDLLGEGFSEARPDGRITHNGQPVPFQPVNPCLGEVADLGRGRAPTTPAPCHAGGWLAQGGDNGSGKRGADADCVMRA